MTHQYFTQIPCPINLSTFKQISWKSEQTLDSIMYYVTKNISLGNFACPYLFIYLYCIINLKTTKKKGKKDFQLTQIYQN